MIKDRRIGKFTVSEKLLHDAVDTGHGANLFVGMVPLDVQRDWLTGRTTFTAWHPDFQAIEEGRIVPEYVPRFDNGITAPTWVHVEGTRPAPPSPSQPPCSPPTQPQHPQGVRHQFRWMGVVRHCFGEMK